MTLKLISRPHVTRKVINAMLDADGHWIELDGEQPLVKSAACRHYWFRKLGCRIEIAQDTDTGAFFGRLVR